MHAQKPRGRPFRTGTPRQRSACVTSFCEMLPEPSASNRLHALTLRIGIEYMSDKRSMATVTSPYVLEAL